MAVDPRDFTPLAITKIAPPCGCCEDGGSVDIAQGQAIYPSRPDLWSHPDGTERWWWLCSSCRGYVGCHKDTLKPLGTPADKATRRAREAAHAVFDPLWQKRQRLSGLTRSVARGRGYKWLADQLGIDRKRCHIGEMNAEMAMQVVAICKKARDA